MISQKEQVKIYSDKVIEIAPCTRNFTKTEISRRFEYAEAVEYQKHLDEIYSRLIEDGLIEQVPDVHENWVRMTSKGVDKKFSGYDSEEFTINRILQELYNSPEKKKFYHDILDENGTKFDSYKGVDMSRILFYEDLIIWQEKSEVWQLSPKGRRIVRNGGWIEHNESKAIRKKEEKKLKYYQFSDVKFKYYAFWPVFIFALIGGIYSCIKIIESLSHK